MYEVRDFLWHLLTYHCSALHFPVPAPRLTGPLSPYNSPFSAFMHMLSPMAFERKGVLSLPPFLFFFPPSFLSLHSLSSIFIYGVCVCEGGVCLCVLICTCIEVRGQLVRMGSLPPLCKLLGSNSGCQGFWQVPLSSTLSFQIFSIIISH